MVLLGWLQIQSLPSFFLLSFSSSLFPFLPLPLSFLLSVVIKSLSTTFFTSILLFLTVEPQPYLVIFSVFGSVAFCLFSFLSTFLWTFIATFVLNKKYIIKTCSESESHKKEEENWGFKALMIDSKLSFSKSFLIPNVLILLTLLSMLQVIVGLNLYRVYYSTSIPIESFNQFYCVENGIFGEWGRKCYDGRIHTLPSFFFFSRSGITV